jgi:hypothetical protein
MNSRTRRLSAILAALAFLVVASPGATAASIMSNPLAQASAAGSAARTAAKAPCADPAYSLLGGRWNKPVRWTFNANSTPSKLNVAAAEAAIVKSFNNITRAFNNCGRPDRVSARHVYDGRAIRGPNISKHGYCKPFDGRNAVAFGRLPIGVLAVTCTRHLGSFIAEADIRINNRYPWAVNAAKCHNQELIEPTVTHEVGHVFGLGHVGERKHPLLTMSTASDGRCNNAASTLALGDLKGLEALY